MYNRFRFGIAVATLAMANVVVAMMPRPAMAVEEVWGICGSIAGTQACYCSLQLAYECDHYSDCYERYPSFCTIPWPEE